MPHMLHALPGLRHRGQALVAGVLDAMLGLADVFQLARQHGEALFLVQGHGARVFQRAAQLGGFMAQAIGVALELLRQRVHIGVGFLRRIDQCGRGCRRGNRVLALETQHVVTILST